MSARKGWKRMGLLLVCFLLLAAPGVQAEDTAAEELTGRCTFTYSGERHGLEGLLTDGQRAVSCRQEPGELLTIRSPEDMGTLVLRISMFHAAFQLRQRDLRGRLLDDRRVEADTVILSVPLLEGCRQVEIDPEGEPLRLAEASVFGPGPLPPEVPQFASPLERADFLLVSTHPDDEWVFLGGVYPIYGGERGYAGTVVYVTFPDWERAHEAVDGLWIGGMDTYPRFLGFPDIPKNANKSQKARCKQADVTLALVQLYRQIRPLVVVTQDPRNGEYGHWQHKLTANAAFDAVALAADPAYDPESAAQYGTWTVQKVYQHFAKGVSALTLDVNAPLARYGGQNALQVARAAFRAHRSQQKTKYWPGSRDRTKGDIVHFGLTWSAVGPDELGDLFEHIPLEALTGGPKPAATATPSPTPTPTPTAEPTFTPTPGATATPSPTAVPSPTATAYAWDRAEQDARWAADRAAPLAAAIVALAALLVAWKQYRRARH